MNENEAVAETFLDALDQNVDTSFKPQIVFPGQDVTSLFTKGEHLLKIGKGLVRTHDRIVATLPGQLCYRPPASYWIESCGKRYVPRTGDQVVGVIEDRGGDFYIVNIFTGANTILSRLSFEGATKRNKPELKKGDVIYARVDKAGKDMDTELSCISSSGIKKEWSCGETVSTRP
jgi:exosome complex component RRP40